MIKKKKIKHSYYIDIYIDNYTLIKGYAVNK